LLYCILFTEASTGLQWKVRYQIIKSICEGVNYLHQHRNIHMDLKPQNILLDDSMVPKIVDFGLSRRLSESQSRTITEHIVGTPYATQLYRPFVRHQSALVHTHSFIFYSLHQYI
jgi:serine/threonine protein kinase